MPKFGIYRAKVSIRAVLKWFQKNLWNHLSHAYKFYVSSG